MALDDFHEIDLFRTKEEKLWDERGRFVYAIIKRLEIKRFSRMTEMKKDIRWEAVLRDKKSNMVVMYCGCHRLKKEAVSSVKRFLHI